MRTLSEGLVYAIKLTFRSTIMMLDPDVSPILLLHWIQFLRIQLTSAYIHTEVTRRGHNVAAGGSKGTSTRISGPFG